MLLRRADVIMTSSKMSF